MKYKVEYTVKGFENVFYSEEYFSYQQVIENKLDIEGYEGVENVSIIEIEEK